MITIDLHSSEILRKPMGLTFDCVGIRIPGRNSYLLLYEGSYADMYRPWANNTNVLVEFRYKPENLYSYTIVNKNHVKKIEIIKDENRKTDRKQHCRRKSDITTQASKGVGLFPKRVRK